MSEKIIDTGGTLPTEFTIKRDGGLEVRTFQDVDPILKANKQMQNDPNFDGYTPDKSMKHVANIPLILIHQWAKDAGVSPFSQRMNEIIKKKLNDPDYAYLRTGGGRI